MESQHKHKKLITFNCFINKVDTVNKVNKTVNTVKNIYLIKKRFSCFSCFSLPARGKQNKKCTRPSLLFLTSYIYRSLLKLVFQIILVKFRKSPTLFRICSNNSCSKEKSPLGWNLREMGFLIHCIAYKGLKTLTITKYMNYKITK